jgi:hypothetical protein
MLVSLTSVEHGGAVADMPADRRAIAAATTRKPAIGRSYVANVIVD